jgi:hypothetical protein
VIHRRHARIVCEQNRVALIELTGKGNTRARPDAGSEWRALAKDERVDLAPGVEVMIGNAVVLIARAPDGAPPPAGAPAAATQRCHRCGEPSAASVCAVCAKLPDPSMILIVEGFEPVYVAHARRSVHRFPVTSDAVLIGRADPQGQTQPDIDLTQFTREFEDATIHRRHVRIVRERGPTLRHFLIELGGRKNTAVKQPGDASWRTLALDERVELAPDTAVVLGGTVRFRVASP